LKTFLHHRLPSKPFTYGLERDVCMYTTVPDGPAVETVYLWAGA
jgi:hypothetical protein